MPKDLGKPPWAIKLHQLAGEEKSVCTAVSPLFYTVFMYLFDVWPNFFHIEFQRQTLAQSPLILMSRNTHTSKI